MIYDLTSGQRAPQSGSLFGFGENGTPAIKSSLVMYYSIWPATHRIYGCLYLATRMVDFLLVDVGRKFIRGCYGLVYLIQMIFIDQLDFQGPPIMGLLTHTIPISLP